MEMKISLLQIKQNKLYEFEKSQYFSFDERMNLMSEMLNKTARMAETAAQEGCDYIITPEAVNFTGVPVDRETFNAVENFGGKSFKIFSDISKKYSVNICAGLYNKRKDNVYNSAVFFNRKGNVEYIYDKVNLAGDENKMITAGNKYLIINTKYGKIAPLICWDMQCGAAKAVADMGADIIFCPTWGWENNYGIECAAKNSLYIAAAMAMPYKRNIEGERTPSELLSKNGEIIAIASNDKECILTKEISILR